MGNGTSKGAGSRERGSGLVITATGLFTLACAVLIAVVIAWSADKEAQTTPNGVKLASVEITGREIFGQTCGNCHKLAAAGSVGDIGPNLDALAPSRELVVNAIEHGRSNGRGEMPPGLLNSRQAEAVAAFVEKAVQGSASEE